MAGRRRRGGRAALVLVLLALVALGPTIYTRGVAMPREYSVSTAPARPVALVLGASVQPDGQPSPFLAQRLQVAKELYEAGKVRAILVTGDNGTKGYDEPTAMRTWLVEHGVPEKRIAVDYAGFDTYDSCYRAGAIFGAHEVIVVTQTYHLHRAVTICRHLGLDAIGVGDSSVSWGSEAWRRGVVREVPATWKMVVDLVTHRQPTLGERETTLDEALR